MVMSHSLTYAIELVDYLDSLIVEAEATIVADASCPAVYSFATDDDLMEVVLAAAAVAAAAVVVPVAVALDSIPFVERPDWVVVPRNSYCTSMLDDNNARSSNYSADGVGCAWGPIADTSSSG